MRGMQSSDLSAIVDFIYLGEANVFQDQLQSFLAAAEELQLKGLDGSSEEKASEFSNESFSPPQAERKAIFEEKRQNGPRFLSNIKYQADTFEGTVMPYHQKMKTKSIVQPDTMARIEMMIEKQAAGGYSCNNCGYTTNMLGHMKEHVEKHIEGLEYPCNSCNKVMRSSHSFRNHRRKYCH